MESLITGPDGLSLRAKLRATRDWRRLARDARFKVPALAKACGVSTRTLRRFFHDELRTSLRVWLTRQRVYFAKEELRRRAPLDLQIKAIAYDAACYTRPENFSRQFKRTCHLSPSAWLLAQFAASAILRC